MQENKWSWVSTLIGTVLLASYFASRLFHLTLLPMFVDEGMHIGWAVQMMQEGRLLGVTDVGKFFPIWVMSLVVPFVDKDLLWAMRLVSVGMGVFGLLGCYLLGKRLFGRGIGVITAILYLVVPYTFFHDRMALVDTLLTALAIFIVLFSLDLVRQASLRYGIGLGIVLALAIMTKFNGFVLGVLPLVVITIHFRWSIRDPLWKYLLLAYGIGVLGLVPLLIEFLPQLHGIVEKMWLDKSDTTLWLTWLINGRDALLYLAQNISLPLFIATCLGVGIAVVQRRRDELLLVGAASVTIAVFVLFSQVGEWYPRYLLPAVPFLLLIAARTIAMVADKLSELLLKEQGKGWSYIISYGLVLILILPALWFDYWLVVDPPRAPFVEIDQWQYIKGTPAGYGLPEVANYLRNQLSHSERIIVVYDEHPSTLPRVLQVYLYEQRQHITHLVFGFWREDLDYLSQHLLLQPDPIFIVVSDPPDPGLQVDFNSWPHIQRVAHFERPGGLTSINVYQGLK